MAKQVVGLFDTMTDAQAVVQELRNAGFSADDISLVANNASGEATMADGDTGTEAGEGASAGAIGGGLLGGLGGLLVGLGALAIPGIGPVVAAGSLAAALGSAAVGAGLGAAAGGLVGALVGAGIPEEDANIYSEGIRRGGALVTVQADADADADRAADIMDRYNVVDIDERGQDYRAGGWSRFDENAGASDRSADRTMAGTMGGTAAGATMGSTAGYSDRDRTDYATADRGTTTDSPQSEWSESSKVGTAGGGLAGAATGAAIGSVGGPVGTVIGGIAGAVTGAGVGAAGDAAGEAASDAAAGEDDRGAMSTGTRGMGGGAAIGSATDYGTTDRDTTAARGTTGYATTDTSRTDYTTTDATTTGTSTTGLQAGTREVGADQGEVAIPVIEEEIRVGKREVESGGVRVSTRVEETPVQEQVTLREEQVHVERRTVDQPVDAATVADAFREGTFEVRERSEQAVVQKEARVVEEVVINKDVEQRTETIQDSVRRTDVDVQEIPGQTRTSGYTETSRTSTSDMSTMGGTSTMDTTSSMSDTSTTGATSSTRYDDVSRIGGTDSTSGDEGMIEGTLGDAKAGAERTTGLDLDRSGQTGDRDRRDNF